MANERCECTTGQPQGKQCGKRAEFVDLFTQEKLCRACRSAYYTLDEVEAIERRPRNSPLFHRPMEVRLAVCMPSSDFRQLLSDLVDTVVDEVDELTGRLLNQVERSRSALNQGVQ